MYSCASTETSSETTSSTSSGIFPDWYSNAGFRSDSVSFYGFGTAIAADSLRAIERAEVNARLQLDAKIGKLTEDVRVQLEFEGVSNVGNTDFILILRNAHADAATHSEISAVVSKKDGSIYRAFASVGIEKNDFVKHLESGFNGHPRYWASYSESDAFKNILH